jgi:flagellar basal-body rod modification protein FlgD
MKVARDITEKDQVMASITPVNAVNGTADGSEASAGATAKSAFGSSFEDLLKIVLTQLTYQDPLKPMDNAEFVSQLAQFSQVQQSQQMTERLQSVLQSAVATQAVGLLGRTVEAASGQTKITGKVTSVAFQNGEPRVSILSSSGASLEGLSLSAISQVQGRS